MPASQIDEQVVKMSFDNSNFDSNVNDSIRTLNNLDKRLAIFDNKENLNNINASFSNLANTFSIKGQIMFGVLSSLGKELYSLGKRAWGTLTKGMRDGLGEYKQIIDSTESIYQNVKQNGNSLQDVNNALDELNDYADKTIYNFGQMTRMIGMFSSAGVGLKDSVNSIKGLSNAAALVGANMQKAQIGWNAVSRAMSSGKFTNMTWRSLELSGIAGKQFNKVITEVARTMHVKGQKTGKDIDGMIKKYGSLRESLQEGWLKKDVFAEAMTIMANEMSKAEMKRKGYSDKQIKELREIAEAAEEAATKVKTFQQLMETVGEAVGSGWAQSFRILLGDLEQAKKLYTRISNVISDFIDNNANIRNKLFKQIVDGEDKSVNGEWKTGRDNFKQIIENMLAIVKTFLKSVKTGFYNIFPIDRISAAARKVLDVFQNFTRAFVLNASEIKKDGQELWDTSKIEKVTDAIKDLMRFFRGLASVIDIAWMAISQPIKAVIKRIPFFNNFFKNTHNGIIGIVNQLGKFGDKITVFRNAIKNTNLFGEAIEFVFDNIDMLSKEYPVIGAIVWVFNSLRKAVTGIKNVFKELNIKPLSAAFGLFKMVVTAIWKVFNSLFGLIKNAKNSVDWSWLEGPKNFIINLLKSLSDYGRGLTTFEETTEKIGGSLGKFFSSLNKIFNKSIATNKIVTATSEVNKQYSQLNVTVDKTGKKIQSVWDKIKNFFKPVSEYFKNLKNNGEFTFDGIAKKIGLVGGGIAAATIGISHLVKTVKKIKIVDNINELLGAGIDVLKAYQKQAQSKTILNIAIAIGILAAAMVALAFVPYDKLESGLTIFTAFMAVLATTLTPIINSIARLNEALAKNKKILTEYDVLNNLTNQVRQIGLKLAKGFNKQSLGKMFKDVAFSILILVGALSALVLLFKFDKDNTITAIKELAKIILILAGAVGVLVLVMNLFSKTATNFAGTFSQFAKLAGVSGIIISMSLAVLVLVGAMAALSKIKADRLESSFVIIVSLMAFLGAIAVMITGIASNASSFDNLKKISIRISGAVIAVVAIAASFALLVKYIDQYGNSGAWWKALITIGTLITVFTGMIAALLGVASKVKDVMVFKKLNSLALVMTGSVLAIAGAIYLLGSSNPIPPSVVTTIGILTVATVSLLAFMAVVTAKANSDFSTKFVKVIEGIAFAISAVVASFGILTAGVAALIAAIDSVDISNSDSTKATNKIINKVKHIAEVISKALPELKKLFYSIGQSVGTVFVSFTSGFIDRIVDVGDKYNAIIEKVVNLIIDLLEKIIGVLHRRRNDVAKIIQKLISFLAAEIAAAVNAFFKNSNGQGIISEDQVLKFLGIGALTFSGGASLVKIAGNFNTIRTSLKNISDMFNIIKKSQPYQDLIFYANYYNSTLWTSISKLKVVDKLGTKISAKTGLKWNPTADVPIWKTAAAIAAVVAAIEACKLAYHGLRQLSGKEAQYMRSDVQTLGDGIKAFFTDAQFRSQALIYTMTLVGRVLLTVANTIIGGIIGVVSRAVQVLLWTIEKPFELIMRFWGLFDKRYKETADKMSEFVKSFGEVSDNSFKGIGTAWKNVGDFTLGDKWEDAAQESKEGGYKVGRGFVEGTIEGIEDYADSVNKKLTEDDQKIINRWKKTWKINSPSKVTKLLYENIIKGCAVGINSNKKLVTQALKDFDKEVMSGAIDSSKAIEQVVENITGKAYTKVDTLRNLRVKVDDSGAGEGTQKDVMLNRELLEIMIQQKEALEGKSRADAAQILLSEAAAKGIAATGQEAVDMINAVYTLQDDKTQVTAAGIEKLNNNTMASIGELADSETAAMSLVVDDTMQKYIEIMNLTKDHQSELIGKKREEVQEFLKQEALKRGMEEDAAEETSKAVTAQLFAGTKANAKLTQTDLTNKLNMYDEDYEAYRKLEEAKNTVYQEALDARANMLKKQEELQNKLALGQISYKDYVVEMKPYVDKLNSLKSAYKNIVDQQAADIKKMGLKNDKTMEKAVKQAKNLLNKSKSNQRGSFSSVIDVFKKALGFGAGDLDLGTYNQEDDDTGKKKSKDKDGKDPVDKAKNLKKNLEAQRADLTPTIDLDKLSDEAKKANGIVTSSLMAAQNASIGDYINKDSELNPFMKDRWQNVYNFTQNNYSPKALSRTDIYRQTQRQINLSRGF